MTWAYSLRVPYLLGLLCGHSEVQFGEVMRRYTLRRGTLINLEWLIEAVRSAPPRKVIQKVFARKPIELSKRLVDRGVGAIESNIPLFST